LWSVLAVALFLAIPSFAYTSELLTRTPTPCELLALFPAALALERPTVVASYSARGAGLALAVRPQGLVFG